MTEMIKKFITVFVIFFLLTVIIYSAITLSNYNKSPIISTTATKKSDIISNVTTIVKVTSAKSSVSNTDKNPITTTATAEQTVTVPQTVVTTKKQPITNISTETQVTTTMPITTPKITTVKTEPITTTSKQTVTTTLSQIITEPVDYSKYIDPIGEDWSDYYLLLVNAENPISPDYEKSVSPLSNIVSSSIITDYDYGRFMNFELNECALKALTAMILEAEKDGIKNLYPISSYRTYAYQEKLFANNVKLTHNFLCSACSVNWIGKSSTCPVCGQKATAELPVSMEEKEKNVATYSCRPGTSDHQTGLVVDLVQTSLPNKYLHLIQEFGDTEAGKWLEENCTRFGFILRFPKDKEDITGIIYEPWHFRFVGKNHAEKMRDLGMSLEEYTEYLSEQSKNTLDTSSENLDLPSEYR